MAVLLSSNGGRLGATLIGVDSTPRLVCGMLSLGPRGLQLGSGCGRLRRARWCRGPSGCPRLDMPALSSGTSSRQPLPNGEWPAERGRRDGWPSVARVGEGLCACAPFAWRGTRRCAEQKHAGSSTPPHAPWHPHRGGEAVGVWSAAEERHVAAAEECCGLARLCDSVSVRSRVAPKVGAHSLSLSFSPSLFACLECLRLLVSACPSARSNLGLSEFSRQSRPRQCTTGPEQCPAARL